MSSLVNIQLLLPHLWITDFISIVSWTIVEWTFVAWSKVPWTLYVSIQNLTNIRLVVPEKWLLGQLLPGQMSLG